MRENMGFLTELRVCKHTGKVSDLLAQAFFDLANGMLKQSSWNRYSIEIKEDLRQAALFDCLQRWHNYNVCKVNPRAYFSRLIFNSFQKSMNRQYNILNHEIQMTDEQS